LEGHADFCDDSSFRLKSCPFDGSIPLGLYELPRRTGEAHLYRLNHPLAEAVIAQAKGRSLPVREVRFDYRDHDGKISSLEPHVGKSGLRMTFLKFLRSIGKTEITDLAQTGLADMRFEAADFSVVIAVIEADFAHRQASAFGLRNHCLS